MLFSLISLSVYVYAYKDELLAGISSGICNQIQKYDGQHPTNSANTIMDFIQKNVSRSIFKIINNSIIYKYLVFSSFSLIKLNSIAPCKTDMKCNFYINCLHRYIKQYWSVQEV